LTHRVGLGLSPEKVRSWRALVNELRFLGHGTSGILTGLDPVHRNKQIFINVVNDNGKIHFIDAQKARWPSSSSGCIPRRSC
jgi:hypothetical protein